MLVTSGTATSISFDGTLNATQTMVVTSGTATSISFDGTDTMAQTMYVQTGAVATSISFDGTLNATQTMVVTGSTTSATSISFDGTDTMAQTMYVQTGAVATSISFDGTLNATQTMLVTSGTATSINFDGTLNATQTMVVTSGTATSISFDGTGTAAQTMYVQTGAVATSISFDGTLNATQTMVVSGSGSNATSISFDGTLNATQTMVVNGTGSAATSISFDGTDTMAQTMYVQTGAVATSISFDGTLNATQTMVVSGSGSNATSISFDGTDTMAQTMYVQTGAVATSISFDGTLNATQTMVVSGNSASATSISFDGTDTMAQTMYLQTGAVATSITFDGTLNATQTMVVTSGTATSISFDGTLNATQTMVVTSGTATSISFDGTDTMAQTMYVQTGAVATSITFDGTLNATQTMTVSGPGSTATSISFDGTGAMAQTMLVQTGAVATSISFDGTLNATQTMVVSGSGSNATSISWDASDSSSANSFVVQSGGVASNFNYVGGDGYSVFVVDNATASGVTIDGANEDVTVAIGGSFTGTITPGTKNTSYLIYGDATGNLVLKDHRTAAGADVTPETLDFSSFSRGGITLDLESTAAQVINPGLTITLTDAENIENVVGTSFSDTLSGNSQDNTILGADLPDSRDLGATHPWNGRTQWVLLDFDTYTDAGEHQYTQAERDAVQARIAADYIGPDPSHPWFHFAFTENAADIPAGTAYTTLYFNKTPSFGPGGESSEIDFRNLNGGGSASIQVNGILGVPGQPPDNFGQVPDSQDNWVALSSKIAAHELAHLAGARHQDAFGPIGFGIHTPPGANRYNPRYPGPSAAFETFDHLISSGASVGSDRFNDLRDLSFGEREAVKLAFADAAPSSPDGSLLVAEQAPAHGNSAIAQPLNLVSLAVPTTELEGLNADKQWVYGVVDVVGEIGIDPATGKSQGDFYSFTGKKGDVISLEVISDALARYAGNSIDSVVRVYDASGHLVNYYGESAVSDDQFEPTESTILDLKLPADGTYYIEVDTFAFAPDDPRNALYPDSDAAKDTDTGNYELFIYRFDTFNATDGGDVIEGRGGNDALAGGLGNDTFIIAGNVTQAGTMDGGAGSDTVIGPNLTSTWNITAADAGNINGKVAFSSVENLVGGTQADTFKFYKGGSVSKSIDGGAAINTLDYSSRSDAVIVDLPLHQASLVNSFAINSVFNIQNVNGSQGSNILVGDANANVLAGGAARSIVSGGADDDIVVSGTTSYDPDLTALNAILNEWKRTDLAYQNRVNDVMVGSSSGLNGPYVLYKASSATETALDDTSADTLTGNAGLDLFFSDLQQDTVTDKVSSEKLVNLANVAGTNKALLEGASVDSNTSSLGTRADLLTGPLFVSIQEDDGSSVPADIEARIEDALTTWGVRFADQGTSFMIVPDGTEAADFQIHLGDTSAVGGLSDGVLGCTTASGVITLITGWNWYTGADATKVGSDQFDFQTIVTHELGHALGLGHSADTDSVMYPYLATGQARRDLTNGDVAVLGADNDGTQALRVDSSVHHQSQTVSAHEPAGGVRADLASLLPPVQNSNANPSLIGSSADRPAIFRTDVANSDQGNAAVPEHSSTTDFGAGRGKSPNPSVDGWGKTVASFDQHVSIGGGLAAGAAGKAGGRGISASALTASGRNDGAAARDHALIRAIASDVILRDTAADWLACSFEEDTWFDSWTRTHDELSGALAAVAAALNGLPGIVTASESKRTGAGLNVAPQQSRRLGTRA